MNKLRERWSAVWYQIVCFVAVGCVFSIKHHDLRFPLFWSISMSVAALMLTKNKTRIVWRPVSVTILVAGLAAICAVTWIVF